MTTGTNSPIEKHAARVYTRGAFERFKEQFGWSLHYKVEKTSNEKQLLLVRIGDDNMQNWSRKVYEVEANIEDNEFCCVCKLYEHLGILCRHIIRVMPLNFIIQN